MKSVRLLVSCQMSELSVRLASRRRRAACGPCGRRSRGARAGRAPIASRAPRFPSPPRGAAARATGRRVCASCGSSSGTARHTASRMATAAATKVRLPERFKREYVLNPMCTITWHSFQVKINDISKKSYKSSPGTTSIRMNGPPGRFTGMWS